MREKKSGRLEQKMRKTRHWRKAFTGRMSKKGVLQTKVRKPWPRPLVHWLTDSFLGTVRPEKAMHSDEKLLFLAVCSVVRQTLALCHHKAPVSPHSFLRSLILRQSIVGQFNVSQCHGCSEKGQEIKTVTARERGNTGTQLNGLENSRTFTYFRLSAESGLATMRQPLSASNFCSIAFYSSLLIS